MCVAFDDAGNVLTSTTPGQDSGWVRSRIRGATGGGVVSCPTVSFCAIAETGLGSDGRIFTSTDPIAGAGAWHAIRPPGAGTLAAISCPTVALCVAVNQSGDVITSRDPIGSLAAWTVARVDRSRGASFFSLACPSVSLCVAVDARGSVFSSTDPAGGARAWRHFKSPGGAVLACPSVSFCLVAGGGTLSSHNPAGGRGAWRSAGVDALGLISLSMACPSASFCVVGQIFGFIATSTNPSGGSSAWRQGRIGATSDVNAISCPTVTLCIAADAVGNVIVAAPSTVSVMAPRVFVRHDTELAGATPRKRGKKLLVDSGIAVACPTHGPACTVRGDSTADERSGGVVLIGQVRITVAPGRTREITFDLTAKGARLLRKERGFYISTLDIVARAGLGPAAANDLVYSINPALARNARSPELR
jgi:hypothetical protein